MVGKVIDTCIATKRIKCWRTYHTTQLPYKVIQLHCIHLTYKNQPSSIGKWMLWSLRGRGKGGEKYIFVTLCNLSGQKLKTKESNIPEWWRRFKPLAFCAWSYHHPKTQIRKTIPFYQCELLNELRRQLLNF